MKFDFGSRTKAFAEGIQFEADDNFPYKDCSFCLNNWGYVKFSGRNSGLNGKYLHRILMGEPNGLMIDHTDMNKLNNCRSNLRVATHSQNRQNIIKRIDNKSGFKGVCWDKDRQKWRVYIDGKYYGLFVNAELANNHAILKRAELHGEFARN
jgi:hypothetical protein